MTCPHCGAAVPPGSRFCTRCRKRVGADAPAAGPQTRPTGYSPRARAGHASARFERPAVVTILGVLNLLGGALALVAAVVTAFVGLSATRDGGVVMALVGTAYALIGVLQLATGIGLLGLKPWARSLQMGLAVIGLLGIPCGTIVSVLVLVYMLKPEVKLLFSGASPQELEPEELAMVQGLRRGSGAVVAIVAALVVLVGVFSVGIVAAIAIPSLLRARVSANESATIGDLRTLASAQFAYAATNGGFGDRPECLARPAQCIPGYDESMPTFVDASLLQEQRHGYRFRFVSGPAAPHAPGISASSLDGWAYLGEPITPGQTGVRAFCIDASAMVCADADGRLGDVSGGSCPSDCLPLR